MLFSFIKFLHIFFVGLWIGGILFTVIINRNLRKIMDRENALKTLIMIANSIRAYMELSLFMAIITGILLLILRNVPVFDINFYNSKFGFVFLLKFISVSILIVLTIFHVIFGKSLSKDLRNEKLRKNLMIVGWLVLLFSLIVMFLGSLIRTGGF